MFIDLLQKGVTDIYICGLAFDYCVKFTAEDAAQHGFNTYLVVDACRSTCKEGHSQTAYENIKKCGVTFLKTSDVSIWYVGVTLYLSLIVEQDIAQCTVISTLL